MWWRPEQGEERDERVGRTLWSPAGAQGKNLSREAIGEFLQAVRALPCPGEPIGRAAGSPRLRAAAGTSSSRGTKDWAKLEPEPEPRNLPVAVSPAAARLTVDTAAAAAASEEQDAAAAVTEAIARALPPQLVPLTEEEALSALHAADYEPKHALAGLSGDSPAEAAGAAALDFSGPKRCGCACSGAPVLLRH